MNNLINSNTCNSLHISATFNPPRCSLSASGNLDNNIRAQADQTINQTQIINNSEIEESFQPFQAEPFEDNGMPILDHMELMDQRSDQDMEVSEGNVLDRFLEGDSFLSLRSFYISAFNDGYEVSFVHDLFSQEMAGYENSHDSKLIPKCDFSKIAEVTFEEEKNDDDLCAICLDKYIKGEILSKLVCNHRFHKECTKKWLISKNACPICRRVLS